VTPVPVAAAAVRWLTFGCMAASIGAACFRFLVHPRTSPDDALAARRRLAIAARAGAWTALLLAPLGVLRYLLLLLEFRDPAEPWADAASIVLGLPVTRAWIAQVVLAVVAFVAFRKAGDGRGRGWGVAGACVIALAFVPAFSGHAIATDKGRFFAVLADGLHVLAGGGWIGTLAIVGLIVAARGAPGQENAAGTLDLVRRFSPVALTCAAIIVATGLISTIYHIDFASLGTLWRNGWARVLLLKVVLVLAVVGAGFHNWRRATPHLAATGDAAGIRRSIAYEIAFAVLVLLATAVLVATPPPGE
jgi:putative copper resistance protein D